MDFCRIFSSKCLCLHLVVVWVVNVSVSTYWFTPYIFSQICAHEAQLVTDDILEEAFYEEHESQVGKIKGKGVMCLLLLSFFPMKHLGEWRFTEI